MFLNRQEVWYNEKYIGQKQKYGRIYAKLLTVVMLGKRDGSRVGGLSKFTYIPLSWSSSFVCFFYNVYILVLKLKNNVLNYETFFLSTWNI